MNEMATAWSHTVRVDTEPVSRLYDVRGTLVDELRGLAELDRFRVTDDEVSAVFSGPREVHVGVNRTLYVSYADLDDDVVMPKVIGKLSEFLNPTVTKLVLGFQHLVELPNPAEDVTAQSSRALLGVLADDANIQDYALLIDGRDIDLNCVYQAEFGVISADEAPLRLAKFAGRLHGEPSAALDLLMQMEFPEAAMFVDSRWTIPQEMGTGPIMELPSLVQRVEARARKLADRLSESVSPKRVRG